MSRIQPITDWLKKNDARGLAELKAPNGVVVLYSVGTRILIIHWYSDGGWECYCPVSDKNEIRATLAALDLRYTEPTVKEPG